MAVNVTYDAPSNTITVTGGTEGTPATFADIQAANDAGGWGVMTTQGGRQHFLTARFKIGDGSTTTHFKDVNKQIYFYGSGLWLQTQNNAYFTLGEKIDGEPRSGCHLCFDDLQYEFTDGLGVSGATINLYDSIIAWDGADYTHLYFYCAGEFNRVKFIPIRGDTSKNGLILHNTSDITLKDIYLELGFRFQFRNTPTIEPDKLILNASDGGFLEAGWCNPVTIKNLELINYSSGTSIYLQYCTDFYLINANSEAFSQVKISRNGDKIHRQHTCNVHIADKDGSNLSGVTILCEDKDNNTVFSVNTGADGKIAEQVITYKKWEGTSEILTEYSPHKFTISKAGYETLVLDEITVDEPIDWHLELLPALAEADVREATVFGENKTGTLDLPSVNDVEKGVQFDNLAKTGVLKVPAEADVRQGEGYGANDNEFTGELDLPAEGDVEKGVKYDDETKEGNFEAPAEADVKKGVGYGANGAEFEGDYEADFPAEEDVEKDVSYDEGAKVGKFHVPEEEDVEVGVGYGANGTEFEGTYLGLKGNNLVAYLQKSVDLVGYLENKVSLTGELKS